MTPDEARRQLERVKFMRELAAIERDHVKRIEERATEMEVEALEVLSEEWREQHTAGVR